MAFRREVYQLVSNQALSGVEADNPYTTAALDLRGHQQRISRIESILVRGASDLLPALITFKVQWAGGITCNQFQNNLSDNFQLFTANDILVTVPAAIDGSNIDLIVLPMPAVYAPFVRFRLTALHNSSADGIFNMWALGTERFDV